MIAFTLICSLIGTSWYLIACKFWKFKFSKKTLAKKTKLNVILTDENLPEKLGEIRTGNIENFFGYIWQTKP